MSDDEASKPTTAPAPPAAAADFPQASSVRPTVSRRLELLWGRAQLEILHRTFATLARLKPSSLQLPDVRLAVTSRPGRPTSPPLVCLHGFGGDKETWLLLAAALGPFVPLYAIDLPGHGASSMPASATGPLTIGRHARAAVAAMDKLGIERAVICGNSMGGGAALRLAVDHPERVAGLVLISSVGSDVHHHAAVAAWRTGKNPLIPEEHEIDDFIAAALDGPNGPSHIPLSVIRYVATTRARAAVRLRKLFDDFTSHHGAEGVPADLSSIRAPALIVHGETDPLVDHEAAEELHRRLAGSELHHLARVGHAPQLEAPRQTAQLVRDFLHRRIQQPLPPRPRR